MLKKIFFYTKKSLLMIMKICGFELISEKSNYGLQSVFLLKKTTSKEKYEFKNNHIVTKLYFYSRFLRDLLYSPIISIFNDYINRFYKK